MLDAIDKEAIREGIAMIKMCGYRGKVPKRRSTIRLSKEGLANAVDKSAFRGLSRKVVKK
jgi:hypothetical protein